VTHFFISYTQVDRLWAEWIAWQVDMFGHQTTLQSWDFDKGSNFILDMDEAIETTERMIAVLSPEYFHSKPCKAEWAAVLAKDPTGEQGLLLPIRVRECHPTGLLRAINYIDLVDLTENEAREVLLSGTNQSRSKPDTAPFFPGKSERTSVKPATDVKPPFPGALSRYFELPFLQNPNFSARDDLIQLLADTLQTVEDQSSINVMVLHGLGGIGKTQLAVEFAYRHARNFDLVWWLNANETSTIEADFSKLALALALPESDFQDQKLAIAKVLEHLQDRPNRWLLIFDDASAPKDIRSFLPRTGAGMVIVTTRNPNWDSVGTPIEVGAWSETEAAAFLSKRVGPEYVHDFGAISSHLGNLPLALEQAGGFIRTTGVTTATYLSLLEKRKPELLSQGSPPDYPDTIKTTWEVGFRQLETESIAAAELIRLCSFLAPDNIPLGMLAVTASLLPGQLQESFQDEFDILKIAAALRRLSLARVEQEQVFVHPLVQAVTLERMTEAERVSFATSAVAVVDAVFPPLSIDVENWWLCAGLLPHALAVSRHAQDLRIRSAAHGRLLNHVGQYFRGQSKYLEALPLLELSLEIAQENFDENDPNLAAILGNLGEVLLALGQVDRSIDCHKMALEVMEGASEENPSVLVSALAGLAHAYWRSNQLSNVKPLLDRALQIAETFAQEDAAVLDTAILLNSIGDLLRELGDPASALPVLDRSLQILTELKGDTHPDTAMPRNNIGLVLAKLYRPHEALTCLMQALEIAEEGYGPLHENTATILSNIADVELELGETASSRRHFERALELEEAIFGPDSVSLVPELHGLGKVCHKQEDWPCCIERFQRAIQLVQEDHRLGSQREANLNNDFGLALEDRGDISGAIEYLRSAYDIARRVRDWRIADGAVYANNLANAYGRKRDFEQAEQWHSRAVALAERPDYENKTNLALFLSQLGADLWMLGKKDQARSKFKRSFRVAHEHYGAQNPVFEFLRLNAKVYYPQHTVEKWDTPIKNRD
jgi:tetratricopeptide (TPR) repeat protein